MKAHELLLALGLAIPFAAMPAHADLWVYIDETGKSHFANEQPDARYQLFYKGPTSLDEPREAPSPPEKPDVDTEGFGRLLEHPNLARFSALIEKHALAHGVDPALVKALVAVESSFNPKAISPRGAVGLMQVIPATGERYGLTSDTRRTIAEKLMDPTTNLRIGTRYLADLLKRFDNDVRLALAGYNAGEYAVERYRRTIPPFRETQAYVKLVEQIRDLFAPAEPTTPELPEPSLRVQVPRHTALE